MEPQTTSGRINRLSWMIVLGIVVGMMLLPLAANAGGRSPDHANSHSKLSSPRRATAQSPRRATTQSPRRATTQSPCRSSAQSPCRATTVMVRLAATAPRVLVRLRRSRSDSGDRVRQIRHTNGPLSQ